MRKQFFLMAICMMAIIPFIHGQNYIGNYEVYNSNSEVYINNPIDDTRVDQTSIILKFTSSNTDATVQSFIQTNNLTEIGEYVGYHVYKLPDNISYISFCQNLAQSLVVEYIVPSIYYSISTQPASGISTGQYYLDLLNVHDAWKITSGHKSVVVAILDHGLLFDEEDFGPDDTSVSNLHENILEDDWDYWDEPHRGNRTDDDGNGYEDDWLGIDLCPTDEDDDYDNDVRPYDPDAINNTCFYGGQTDFRNHGTAVAGVVAAKTNNNEEIDGIAGGDVSRNKSGISILPIKIAGYKKHYGCLDLITESQTTPIILEAIRYAVSQNADIINMSFEVPTVYGDPIEALIDSYYDNGNGPLFVASTGNDGVSNVRSPADFPSVIAVGGSRQNDTHWSGGNWAEDLELVAPSVDIPYLYGSEYGSSDYANGTSFAAPMVCATAALMLSINPDLSSGEIREILKETAYKNPSYFHPSEDWNERLGYGRIDVLAAVCASMPELPEITISGDVTWDMPKYSNHNLIIEDGATLTLNNDLAMDPTAKIIVKRGAKLIVNNARITNLICAGETKWAGIEVWGDPNKSQQDINDNYEQGYLELNNAIIENAETAIYLGKDGNWGTFGGGIVKAYNSQFINNAISLHFTPYKNVVTIGVAIFEKDNEAYFQNCEFTINSDYFTDTDFYKHVDLCQVRGIEFRGCDFKRESNNGTSQFCSGIQAYDAGVIVSPWSADQCNFEGLFKGIDFHDNVANVTYSSYISNSTFVNNSIGIELNAITTLVSIKDNTFHVGYNNSDDKITCSASQSYGIFLDNSNTFVIEDNAFDKYCEAPSDGYYIGIEAFNTQTESDEIFRNTFNGLTHANHAMNQNWTGSTAYGLEYYCNQHSSNNNDLFFAYDGTNLLTSGVQLKQGNQYQSTGNTFTQNVSGYNLYNNTGHDVDYYYNMANATEIPVGYTSATVNPHPQIIAAECSDGGGGIGTVVKSLTAPEKQQLESDYIAAESDYQNVKTLFESLEDGGNTSALKTEVTTSWPEDMWELRAELLGLSPYLTTEVLKTAADKTDVLPESVLFEILSANPDELKKEELMTYLENKEQPLPEYMISILQQLSEGLTAKTAMQGDMSRYNREKSRASRQMLVGLNFDENFNFEEYRVWMGRLGGMKNDQKIVASFIQEENYTDAFALANLIPDLYELGTEELAEHNYFMEMLNLNISLKQQNRSLLDLSSSEYEQLVQLAENSKGMAGVKAEGILEHFYGEHFCNCVNTQVDQNKSTSSAIDPAQFAEAMGLKISAEPNPATAWVAFNYELPIGDENAQLIIKSIDGKQVANFQLSSEIGQKVWDTRSLKAGVYIYEFISGALKQSGKIVIINK